MIVNILLACVLTAAGGYLLGSILFGVLISKVMYNDDVRNHGSGNAGMTNVLRTYGKLPLIEPLESREVKKIRDFVIVVDTSESTAGELVKSFLKETFALLTSQDSFFRKCRILVMQADNAVREETWLTDLDALDRYTARFTLVGGGGTDFRPAFARIAALRREGSLRDLQGVLYFTDGKGIYPAKRPPFEVAFLFLEDGTPPPDVPPWAMRLVLQPEEFTPDTDPKGR